MYLIEIENVENETTASHTHNDDTVFAPDDKNILVNFIIYVKQNFYFITIESSHMDKMIC